MLLVLWVGVGVVTALAAQARGRSFFGWLVLGFLFSVLALGAVLVMRPVEANVTPVRQRDTPRPSRDRPAPVPPAQVGTEVYRGYEIRDILRGVMCKGIMFDSRQAARDWVDAALRRPDD